MEKNLFTDTEKLIVLQADVEVWYLRGETTEKEVIINIGVSLKKQENFQEEGDLYEEIKGIIDNANKPLSIWYLRGETSEHGIIINVGISLPKLKQ